MQSQPQAATIRLEDTFDLPAARLLENSLRRAGPGERVLVDFGGVRHFHDFAVAVLARTLEKCDPTTVRLEGLRFHHVRLLRYFGVAAEFFRPERRGDGDA
jgi:anti-anti-sigma regulatory factor